MIIANEQLTNDLLNATSNEERHSILVRLYVDNVNNTESADVLCRHLIQLETITPHLFATTYGSPSVNTIKGNQLFALFAISTTMISEILERNTNHFYDSVIPVWLTAMDLNQAILCYEGEANDLYTMIRLSNRAVKILLDLSWALTGANARNNRYYSPTEQEVAMALPSAISEIVSVEVQVSALQKNITVLLQKTVCDSLSKQIHLAAQGRSSRVA